MLASSLIGTLIALLIDVESTSEERPSPAAATRIAKDGNGLAPLAPGDGSLECRHPSHRVIRLFLAYAEANAVRLRVAEAPARLAVSRLRRQGDGSWSFTMCSHCLARADDGRLA
jgi:hypothetical protein